ncbi:MAG: PAS domain S-box protein [Candidatus ainarchaeum sp.]|nr:PAS domain S-box protein [Candidatus ainarchaeum sp.]
MKGGYSKPGVLQLLSGLASRAKAAGNRAELSKAAAYAAESGWCDKAFCAIIEDGSAQAYENGAKKEPAPVQGSSLEEVRKGKVYVDNSIGKYSGFFDERKLAEEGFTAYLSAPIEIRGKVLGALCFAKKDGAGFGAEDSAASAVAAGFFSIALSGMELSRKADEAERISGALLRSAADIVIVADGKSGIILEANEGAEVASGYSASELPGMGLHLLFGENAFRAGEGGGMYRLSRKNGEQRTLELRAGKAEADGFGVIVIAGSDATARLRQASDYKDVVESISEMIFTAGGDGKIASVNEEAARALGRSRDSLLGAPFGTIVFERDWNALAEAFASERDIRGVELRLVTGAGEQKWFELNGRVYRDSSGGIVKVAGVLRDIHSKKTDAESAAIAKNMVDNSSDAILILDDRGVIQFANKRSESLFGYAKAELAGRDGYLLFPPGKEGELDALIRKTKYYGSLSNHAAEMAGKGDRRVQASIHSSIVKNAEDKTESQMYIIRDVTSQWKFEEAEKKQRALEEKNRRLNEIDKEKSTFISSVSHELRTPLTSIHGYSSLLLEMEAGALNDEQKRFVSIIHAETERLTKLINDLLDQSRLERGKFKISPELFDLRSLTEKCSCSVLAQKKGLYVKWDVADDAVQVYGDPSRIAQVLLNLVSNAVKFTQEGGVAVRATRLSRSFVRVEVADTGPGISEEGRARLFKAFTQLPSQDGKPKGGSGLGLSISKEIIKLHQGKIGVDSEVGKGSRFWFTLRAQPPKKKKKPDAAGASGPTPAQA